MNEVTIANIEKSIYLIRNQKVMLDSDLADLYEVETANLTRQVRRNSSRFPLDFMFQLTSEEYEIIREDFVKKDSGYGGRRYLPYAFTEAGIAMLSSVLTSERAVQVNISIMRTFIKLRSFMAIENSLPNKVSKLEEGTNKLFKTVFERLDSIEEQIEPKLSPNRKRIGLQRE